MTGGPEQVRAACEAAMSALAAGGFPESGVVGSREQWADVVVAAQQLANTAVAVQDAAIVRLAAIEPEYLEDGTEVESHRAPGHVALDAPAIVSGALGVSASHAEHRVRTAVRLAADGPTGADTATGLGGLHEAMRWGRLDSYRAGVVAAELEMAPGHVAEAVVAALAPHFEVEDGAHLRRRCRRVLARISPDLLVERAKRARAGCGLRRWVEEPGVDRWEGTFPSEDAAHAWAAIDALAQRYVRDGVCPTIENARGKALTDLVAGNATIDTIVTLTVPAAALPSTTSDTTTGAHTTGGGLPATVVLVDGPAGRATATAPMADGDLVEVTGLHGSQPVLVSRQWLTATIDEQRATGPTRITTEQCHPVTGALTDTEKPPTGDTSAGTGAGQDQRVEAWPDDLSAVAARFGGGQGPRVEARPDELSAVAAGFGVDGYRPSARLARRVRARDRRCRFPGCSIAAVFCDLDHVRPWPGGPTDLTNLVSLCRRHHRVKQRPGWRVALALDGTVTWTDPTGRTRTTHPVDALTPTVLRDTDAHRSKAAREPTDIGTGRLGATAETRTMTVLPDGPYSALEFHLEHLLPAGSDRLMTSGWRDDRGRRHRADLTRSPAASTMADDGRRPHRHHRRTTRQATRRTMPTDPPPF